MTTVSELMTRYPVTITPSASVQHAARLMDDLNVGVLPVCSSGRLVGIVTDRDITVRAIAAGMDAATTEVELVMSNHVRSCSWRDALGDVLQTMAEVQIRRLPVLDEKGHLVGMVSLGDIAARHADGVEQALRLISTPCEPDRTERVAA